MFDGIETPARRTWLASPNRSACGNSRVASYTASASSCPFLPHLQAMEVSHPVTSCNPLKKVTLHDYCFMMCLSNLISSKTMERFLKRHQGRINGIIAGFDRILFRGKSTLPT